jgi:hypothetical protein
MALAFSVIFRYLKHSIDSSPSTAAAAAEGRRRMAAMVENPCPPVQVMRRRSNLFRII